MANNTQMDSEEVESSNPAFSRLSILRTVWKRKVRIVLAWVLFAVVGAGVVRFLPAVYLSEAVVMIDTQQIPEKFVSDLKRKVRIVLAWVLFAVVGAGVVRFLPAVYLSEAVVMIDTQQIPEKFV